MPRVHLLGARVCAVPPHTRPQVPHDASRAGRAAGGVLPRPRRGDGVPVWIHIHVRPPHTRHARSAACGGHARDAGATSSAGQGGQLPGTGTKREQLGPAHRERRGQDPQAADGDGRAAHARGELPAHQPCGEHSGVLGRCAPVRDAAWRRGRAAVQEQSVVLLMQAAVCTTAPRGPGQDTGRTARQRTAGRSVRIIPAQRRNGQSCSSQSHAYVRRATR